jgi:hypothetical protein
MKTRIAFMVLAATALLFSACSKTDNPVDELTLSGGDTKSMELVTAPGDSCNFDAVLNENEVTGLLAMREEEKLARDVYRAMFAEYKYIVFNNISKSEDAHMKAVLYLINGFGLIDPARPEEGEFTDPTYQTLYADLTEKGKVSLVEALKIGAFIEEYDIADLETHIAETEVAAIQRVYGNLLRGSKFHLKAFTSALKRQGVSYTPQILTQEEYDAILGESTSGTTSTGTFTPGTGTCDGTGPNT